MVQIFNENHNQDIVRAPKTSTPKKSKNIFRPKKSSAPKPPKISEATLGQASQNSQVVDVELHTPPANPPQNSQVIDVESHTSQAIPPPPPRKIKDEPQDLVYVDGQFKIVPKEKSTTTNTNLMTFTPTTSKGLILTLQYIRFSFRLIINKTNTKYHDKQNPFYRNPLSISVILVF